MAADELQLDADEVKRLLDEPSLRFQCDRDEIIIRVASKVFCRPISLVGWRCRA